MAKYISKENLQQYDSKFKEYIDTKLQNIEYLLAYGVEWDINVADPHITRIGNEKFHKTLPIQSQLKGCVAQGKKIMYYLNEDDWRFRQIPNQYIFKDVTLTFGDFDPVTNNVTITLTHDLFSDMRYKDQYIRIMSQVSKEEQWSIYKIKSINTETKTGTFVGKMPFDSATTDLFTIEFGSVLNGYDGTVRIHCPKFYIKSEEDGDKRRVWITQLNLGLDWQEQPECLIDAYCCTILREVPQNMGYLSTLKVNNYVSIVNNETYCRGGINNAALDSNLETAPERCELNKPFYDTTGMKSARLRCPEETHLLSYNQYKNIIYWLWVIEYANFNSRETYNRNLTPDGYRQGGMGLNLSNFVYFNQFGCYGTIPNGFTNELGNKTGLLPLFINAFDIKYTSSPIGSFQINLSAVVVKRINNDYNITQVKTTEYAFQINTKYQFGSIDFEITGLTDGQTVLFRTYDGKNIYAAASTLEDGVIHVDWPEYTPPTNNRTNYAQILFGKVQSNCNITIKTKTTSTRYEHMDASSYSICRWRGMEALHSAYNTKIDGILTNVEPDKQFSSVYVCDDPKKFSNNFIDNGYYKVGEVINSNGYIKTFNTENTFAQIIPTSVGATPNTYTCGYLALNTVSNNYISNLKVGNNQGGTTYGSIYYFSLFSSVNGDSGFIKTASEL